MKKILVVAAHPDDEILGGGATFKKFTNRGDEVYCVVLGEGMTSRGNGISDKNKVAQLHSDSIESSKIIGFKTMDFVNLPDNKFDSIPLLDVVKCVEKIIDQIKPEIVYTHHHGDLNIDHRVTFNAVLTACRPIDNYSVKELYCFETPSSTEWNYQNNGNAFRPNVYSDVQETIDFKIKAMKCYKSELREYPHPRSLEALRIIAARWGTIVGMKYCEAFELIRKIC